MDDVIKDDNAANGVLTDMHKELIEQINIEEITLYLVPTGMITDAHREALQNERRSTMDRAKYLLGREVLGKKGFMGLKALLDSLRGNAQYKPHLELANKIEQYYLSRVGASHPVPTGGMVPTRQPIDRRTSESLSTISTSTPTSCVQETTSLFKLQFSTPGEYHVKLGHPVDHVGHPVDHVPVAASNVQPKSPLPVKVMYCIIKSNMLY